LPLPRRPTGARFLGPSAAEGRRLPGQVRPRRAVVDSRMMNCSGRSMAWRSDRTRLLFFC
jgi:hypothetical protein